MHTLATAAQMKELDRIAIEDKGIPSLELMERASSFVADHIIKTCPGKSPGRSLFFTWYKPSDHRYAGRYRLQPCNCKEQSHPQHPYRHYTRRIGHRSDKLTYRFRDQL